ncbi:VIT1/CCC1 transporter family protein [Kineosporia sp. A_224]|uniref:VIT1/CCC1 transporter family protein n=1 Tax=Kineosporia sp. A_224 TaxID=1962180 RepID=UPI0018EA1C2D|nr:VIT1/CCC1 transporter family protein [Kineosporia sp. A_224]
MTIFDALAGHPEGHLGHRAGWLRAAVLGANDGLVSTSSLMVGVATASDALGGAVLTAGLAGLAAGAMAMAAGEWVSVSSQSDVERADLDRERRELADDPRGELEELTGIYEQRGLPRDLAELVAAELHKGDVLAVHARDELGHSESSQARPVQAAGASAAAFTLGGLVPFLGMLGAVTGTARILLIVVVTLAGLTVAGALGARAAGTTLGRPTLRVVLGGGAAMAVTALVGHLVGLAGV